MILTQTNWLKMPARELGGSLEPQTGARNLGTTLLKKHKVLPHPRPERIPEPFYTPTPPSRPRDLRIDTGASSVSESDSSSPRLLKHASKRIGDLPPTPPTHSRQSSGNQAGLTSAPRIDTTKSKGLPDASSTPSTPKNQRSPPTPDFTPPRTRGPQVFRPSFTDRYASASSRTDSFKTAQENFESDDDEASTIRPGLMSARQSQTSVPQISSRNQPRREIGLGLGLESDGTTTPRQGGRSQQEFVVFDGEWAASGGETSEVEREWDDNLMRNVTVRKRPRRNIPISIENSPNEVIEDDIVTPTMATRVVRSLPLKERIARHRLERDAADRRSTERFAERIEWPPVVADPESPTTPDVRRFSSVSTRSNTTSAIVEAIVVDVPPVRRNTLRHTKKQMGLRDFSGNSLDSVSVSKPPLHHARGRLPQRRHDSLVSNGTSSTNSNAKSMREVRKEGGIPVVVIPTRRSSTKSSKSPSLRSTSSRRSKRSKSLTSAPLSASSKFNDPEFIARQPVRRRTLSESEGSSHSVRTIDFPPKIPGRSSSLSAPTSRNTSRAPSIASEARNVSRSGSLTAESLKAHNLLEAKKLESIPPLPTHRSTSHKEIVQPESDHHREIGHGSDSHKDGAHKDGEHHASDSHRDLGHRHHQLSVDHNGDPFFGSRLSTQVTPFSQYSYGTAGTAAELSEAQAVEIYPHQNTSVIVVQHPPSSESTPLSVKPVDGPPTMAINGKSTDGPSTPPQPKHPMDEVDSPLRNPREPPIPPAIKFIPPTPAGMTPGHEEERQLGYDPNERPVTSDSKPTRGGSLLRRAFSNRRRNSEPVQPGAGFLKRTFSLSNNKRKEPVEEPRATSSHLSEASDYPTEEDKPAEGDKLHPFWRPAHFWDDLEDDDDYPDGEMGGRYPLYDNRPKPKRTLSEKMKRTFAILPIQDDQNVSEPPRTERRTVRRSSNGNLRVVKHKSKTSLRREAAAERQALNQQRRPYSEGFDTDDKPFGYGFKEGNGGHRGYTIPGLGLRVEYVGFGGLKRRISEKRREQRSQKLRESISGPQGVKSGMDDVLRRGNSNRRSDQLSQQL